MLAALQGLRKKRFSWAVSRSGRESSGVKPNTACRKGLPCRCTCGGTRQHTYQRVLIHSATSSDKHQLPCHSGLIGYLLSNNTSGVISRTQGLLQPVLAAPCCCCAYLEASCQEAFEEVHHGVALHGVDQQGVTVTQLDLLLRHTPILQAPATTNMSIGHHATKTILPLYTDPGASPWFLILSTQSPGTTQQKKPCRKGGLCTAHTGGECTACKAWPHCNPQHTHATLLHTIAAYAPLPKHGRGKVIHANPACLHSRQTRMHSGAEDQSKHTPDTSKQVSLKHQRNTFSRLTVSP